MVFACHVTLQDHTIKYYMALRFGSPQLNHHPIKSDSHKHCGNEDTMVLVCYVISQDHVMKQSHGIISRTQSQ